MADRGIVDQPVKRTEFPAQSFDQFGNLLDLAEIERRKVQRRLVTGLSLGDRLGNLLCFCSAPPR